MRAYLAIKFHSDHQNRKLIESFQQALKKSGYESLCMASDIEGFGKNKFTPSELMQITFNLIDKCDFLLIDATEKGMGLGIEAGYSFAMGKPIFVVAEKGTSISTTLKGIADQIIYYNSPFDLVNILEKYERSSTKN